MKDSPIENVYTSAEQRRERLSDAYIYSIPAMFMMTWISVSIGVNISDAKQLRIAFYAQFISAGSLMISLLSILCTAVVCLSRDFVKRFVGWFNDNYSVEYLTKSQICLSLVTLILCIITSILTGLMFHVGVFYQVIYTALVTLYNMLMYMFLLIIILTKFTSH